MQLPLVSFMFVLLVCVYLQCNFNKQLMTPKVEEGDLLLKQSEDGVIARLKMFIHLRQDLERVCICTVTGVG